MAAIKGWLQQGFGMSVAEYAEKLTRKASVGHGPAWAPLAPPPIPADLGSWKTEESP
jgi:hypothetical protein